MEPTALTVVCKHAGRAAAWIGSAILLATGFWDAVASLRGTATAANVVTPQSMIHGATVACAYLWASAESLRYRAILKRRRARGRKRLSA